MILIIFYIKNHNWKVNGEGLEDKHTAFFQTAAKSSFFIFASISSSFPINLLQNKCDCFSQKTKTSWLFFFFLCIFFFFSFLFFSATNLNLAKKQNSSFLVKTVALEECSHNNSIATWNLWIRIWREGTVHIFYINMQAVVSLLMTNYLSE